MALFRLCRYPWLFLQIFLSYFLSCYFLSRNVISIMVIIGDYMYFKLLFDLCSQKFLFFSFSSSQLKYLNYTSNFSYLLCIIFFFFIAYYLLLQCNNFSNSSKPNNQVFVLFNLPVLLPEQFNFLSYIVEFLLTWIY